MLGNTLAILNESAFVIILRSQDVSNLFEFVGNNLGEKSFEVPT